MNYRLEKCRRRPELYYSFSGDGSHLWAILCHFDPVILGKKLVGWSRVLTIVRHTVLYLKERISDVKSGSSGVVICRRVAIFHFSIFHFLLPDHQIS